MNKADIDVNEIFFELLRVTIGTRSSLSFAPSAEQWMELFALSKKQSLVAIAFAGISRLEKNTHEEVFTQRCQTLLCENLPEMLKLRWLGLTAKIVQRNKELNKECAKVCRDLEMSGFAVTLLKGQSNMLYYLPELKECRTPGDIDVWALKKKDGLSEHKKKVLGLVNRIVLPTEKDTMEVLYHHVDYPVSSNCQVELHFTPSYFNNPFTNRRFQRFVSQSGETLVEKCSLDYGVLTSWFNMVYCIQHLYRHLLSEGIGLRQILDLYMLLRSYHNEAGNYEARKQSMGMWTEGLVRSVRSKEEICDLLNRFRMKKFASAVMWVLHEVFQMPEEYMVCEANEKEGRFVLEEILKGGNFGEHNAEAMKAQSSNSAWGRFCLREKFYFRLLRHYPSEIIWTPFWQVRVWLHIRKYKKYLK